MRPSERYPFNRANLRYSVDPAPWVLLAAQELVAAAVVHIRQESVVVLGVLEQALG